MGEWKEGEECGREKAEDRVRAKDSEEEGGREEGGQEED